MNRTRCFHSGFTLIEILVAVAIFAVFSAMAYSGLMQLLATRDHISAERAFWQELPRVFVGLQDDLGYVRARPIRDIDGRSIPAFRGQPTDTRALGEPNMEFTRGGLLTVGESHRSDLQRVAYRLAEGQLLRLTWPVLDRAPITKPIETKMLDNVESFDARFYSPDGRWLDHWPPDGRIDNLPRGVEITVTIAGRGKFIWLFPVNG